MNVTGELPIILGLMLSVTTLAGIFIGWWIRNRFPSRTENKARQHVARDIDDAMKDAKHLRHDLNDSKLELSDTKTELEALRLKQNTSDSGTRAQVDEINDLKRQLAISKKSVLDNQSEFNTYRTERQTELSEVRRELSNYSAGGSANSERLAEANETVGALRSAVRENDKVIDSLRARVKETDSTVESMRGQLKAAQSNRSEVQSVSLQYDSKVEDLTHKLDDSAATVKKQKSEYDSMLESKNADIKSMHAKLAKQQASHTAEREKETGDLRQVISERDAALTASREQISNLNTAMKAAEQREQQEVQRLTSEVNTFAATRSKIKSKSAEVAALNDMLRDSADKRNSLQNKAITLNKTLEEKDTRINIMRGELDDVVASRNKISAQMGELQTQGNIALEKLQQDFNNLATTRNEYKARIDSLQNQASELKKSKEQQSKELTQHAELEQKKLRDESDSRVTSMQRQVSDLTKSKESQLRELRSQLTTNSQASEKKLKDTNLELATQNSSLQNVIKTLQAKLQDQTRSTETQTINQKKQIEINQRLTSKLQEKDSHLSETRSKLVRAESENQRLNRELSNAEALRLTLTQRDAELRTTQILLEDTKASGGPMQKVVEEQTLKNDSLLSALRERDEEISRLNSQVTNSSVRSKQLQSSITLLNQERETQTVHVRSLEAQADNTLQLHTKIAQQSSELEDLKARLFERDNSSQSTNSNALRTSTQSTTSNLQQIETSIRKAGSTAGAKPRVFVRADTDTEALTGATGYTSSTRAKFTKDGHRVRRPDGSDELTLLPGVTQTIAGAFSRNGVTDFEQISLWTDREVGHYAERVGVSIQSAEQYNWPKTARSILNGTYSMKGQEIGNP